MEQEWSLVLSSEPSTAPLSVADAKRHLNIDISADDTLLRNYITAARRHVEEITGRQLITATWVLYMDVWPATTIVLPRPPLQSVTSIQYVDTNGDTQTWSDDNYRVDDDMVPARITEAWGETWPTIRDVTQAITITFVTGYGDNASDVPSDMVQAIKLLVGHYYENRESVVVGGVPRRIPDTVKALLSPYRLHMWGDRYPGF